MSLSSLLATIETLIAFQPLWDRPKNLERAFSVLLLQSELFGDRCQRCLLSASSRSTNSLTCSAVIIVIRCFQKVAKDTKK